MSCLSERRNASASCVLFKIEKIVNKKTHFEISEEKKRNITFRATSYISKRHSGTSDEHQIECVTKVFAFWFITSSLLT